MIGTPTKHPDPVRRTLLRAATSAIGVVVAGCATAGRREGASHAPERADGEAEVTPGEDLMQEHGVLRRVLLIYEESAWRIDEKGALDLTVLSKAADIVRTFVEDYHEKQEEEYVFPRLRDANRELALVSTLLAQHQRGRQLTEEIRRRASGPADGALAQNLRACVRMYRPHAAREDTVLFPVLREVVGRHGYHELGEQFEEREHALFGADGFARVVAEVAALETALGIEDLARFTPAGR